MTPRLLALVALLALAHPAAAQTASASSPAAPAQVVPATRLRAIGDSLQPAASRTAQLGKGPGLTYALTHRDSSGGLEVHDAWTDVFIVETGSATLLSGGRAVGAKESTPGEWRGGTAEGATRVALHVGDVVAIPAGTPHQMLLAPTERITYLALKVAVPAGAPPAR